MRIISDRAHLSSSCL